MKWCDSDTKELNKFIESKINSNSNINLLKQAFYAYSKVLINCLDTCFKETGNIDYAIECSNILYNVFWILLNHSANIALTIQLSERVILIFNEYIKIYNTYSNNFDNDIIKIAELKQFIYNSTIGTISHYKENSNKNISVIAFNIKSLIENNFLNDTETAVKVSEEYCNKINSLIYKIIKKSNTNDTIKLLSRTLNPDKNIDRIVKELELLFHILKKNSNMNMKSKLFLKNNISFS